MLIKTGDVTLAKGIIAHGCNCQGVMGSGVAKAIRQQFPKAYDEYATLCATKEPKKLLGYTQYVTISNSLIIANCFTQLNYGRTGRKYVSYDALDMCMKTLSEESLHVNFPLIGGGLGGGDKEVIIAIMEKHFPGDNATLWMI